MWTIIIILFILWALGYFGKNVNARLPRTGNWIHILLIIIIILVVLELVGVR